ncbi:DUF2850 domain-containing protein [Vibrio sp. PID17_43]|uniref:DUF2850 domain-containing protein n=1 Tax=Vibrio sp. PID17_43 TaxID=1583451 RepID=UPI000C035EA0|nr:DUF2850 domain-containing protein [Vibrio sp. PID17_43]PHJ41039.1 N-acetylglutamate synthase [Vibrio sp. PID17_43]
MVLSANKGVENSAQIDAEKSMPRKWLERSIMLIAVVGTIVAFMMYGDVFIRYINPPIAKSKVYGKWVEQEVAPYVREEFVLSERGVTVNGAFVTTGFEFDGDSLRYKVGSTVRRFNFVDQQHTEMKLDANAHYLPVFHLEGRSDLTIR